MFRKSTSRKRKSGRVSVQKPNGVLHPRVQQVGPERFGIVCVDIGKAKSVWMLCDFYGKVIVDTSEVLHTRCGFELAIVRLREALKEHRIKDQVVVVERTGNYHLPVKRAYTSAGFETRTVHPFATKQFRQPANPGDKTDPNDLAAMHRATVSGFGLIEQPLDEVSQKLQLLTRHRRDLVQKRSALCCQIREHVDALLPGYLALFDDAWKSKIALHVAEHFPSADAIRQAGIDGMWQSLREAGKPGRQSILQRIVTWSANAIVPGAEASTHQRIWLDLQEDFFRKTREINGLERDIASLLVRTPYVLLLSHPGINVVSAAELAAEMGPITNYASAKSITGRAGLFPSRYQSAGVDHANGKIIRCRNRRLRAVLMNVADNLIQCNNHFRALNSVWKLQGKDPRLCHVRVACRFSRILFQIVAGNQVFRHPSMCDGSYILDKLWVFHREHNSPTQQTLADLRVAIVQIPECEYGKEAAVLQVYLEKGHTNRRRGAKPIGDVLALVLARLGVGAVESSEVQGSS